MKLFTIGDSISQGFMSLAAARTDLAYSTLLALKFGLIPQQDYAFADWDEGGLPLNIENIMRRLNQRYGSDIIPNQATKRPKHNYRQHGIRRNSLSK